MLSILEDETPKEGFACSHKSMALVCVSMMTVWACPPSYITIHVIQPVIIPSLMTDYQDRGHIFGLSVSIHIFGLDTSTHIFGLDSPTQLCGLPWSKLVLYVCIYIYIYIYIYINIYLYIFFIGLSLPCHSIQTSLFLCMSVWVLGLLPPGLLPPGLLPPGLLPPGLLPPDLLPPDLLPPMPFAPQPFAPQSFAPHAFCPPHHGTFEPE